MDHPTRSTFKTKTKELTMTNNKNPFSKQDKRRQLIWKLTRYHLVMESCREISCNRSGIIKTYGGAGNHGETENMDKNVEDLKDDERKKMTQRIV